MDTEIAYVGVAVDVTSFKGISLSTKANSSIFIDPKFEKLVELRKWSERNKEIANHFGSKLNEMYLCNYCKYMHARAIPRARCSVTIGDHTGNIIASLFGDVAEKFLHLPAEKIMKDNLLPHHKMISSDDPKNESAAVHKPDNIITTTKNFGSNVGK
ncbi:unnamed protein product [Fraxinus pennsylvanica]|uniref:Replication factor A C-terminal domain-containing protein n=1 Tax=Fraxinus pennsylvanica TaxID=56036 RepID=A0AAD2A2K8_9LAMI|nr:unnamed protein product [Fraxinus pennsylvanica]